MTKQQGGDNLAPYKVGPDGLLNPGMGRREFIVATAGAVLIGASADYETNAVTDLFANPNPAAHVWPNTQSNNVLIAAPGAGNSGEAVGRLLQHAVGDKATIIGVDYAENNVDPKPITRVVKDALNKLDVPQPSKMRIWHYWLSVGGVIMAPVVHELGEQADLAMLDSTPLTTSDLRGINGVAARMPSEVAYFSWLDWMFRQNKDNSIRDAAQDKAEGVPADLAIAHRNFTVNASLARTAPEVNALNRHILPNALAGFATHAYFMTCPAGPGEQQKLPGIDPLVITETAYPGWNGVLGGNLVLYIDPHRASQSHGIGPIYPGGIRHLIEQHQS